jgi:GntR family transcriptional regulator
VTGRRYLYLSVADALRERLTAGEFQDGALPSELDLATELQVSRLTIRKALGQLRDEKLVESRRGSGWYPARGRVQHSLDQLGTIEGQLAEKGIVAERRILDFSFVPATGKVREVLQVDSVLRVTRLNLGDGEPVARVTAWCPERFGRDMSKSSVEQFSIYDLLPVQLGGATQVITAVEASEEEAALLCVPEGSACLMSERTTHDADGNPILYATAVFPGRSTAYVAHLAQERSSAGLRLSAAGQNGHAP